MTVDEAIKDLVKFAEEKIDENCESGASVADAQEYLLNDIRDYIKENWLIMPKINS
jgi:hypothetical protein